MADSSIAASKAPDLTQPSTSLEPKFGGFTRFEVELEFVQCLANPHYVSRLATLSAPAPLATTNDSQTRVEQTPLLQHAPFIAYLSYLRYFATPSYVKYLMYPGPTLRMLELLQSERFRADVGRPDVVMALVEGGIHSTEKWLGAKGDST